MSATQEGHRKVGDRYTLLATLGRGGMGVVWRAFDEVLRREVAVKEVLLPLAVNAAEARILQARVMREARTAARLSHPGVVTVYDVVSEADHTFLVFELVAARTLAEIVESNGRLRPAAAAQIGLGVLAALEAAHAEGIVHRDVKPGNVMVDDVGHTKLADFGVASLRDDPALTSTGLVVGSPSYMAPEQASGAQVGPATDLWGLGTTLYFAVEGVAPFERGGALPTLTAVLHDPPRPPRNAGALEPVLGGLLAKDPAERPSGPRLRNMLRDAALGGPVRESARTVRVAAPAAPAVRARRRRRSPGPLAAAALVAVVILAAAGFVLPRLAGVDDPGPPAQSRRAPDATPSPPAEDEASPAEPTPSPDPATDPATDEPTDPATDEVDADLVDYTDPAIGYQLAYPQGWEVSQLDGTRTDFRDPDSGMYLRVDWTATPGPSAAQAWRDFEPAFAERVTDYERVTITPVDYRGHDAALWEYTYTGGGVRLHAGNLGFVTGDYGFALNFQTREEDWEASQPLYEAFQEGFRPPE